MPDIIRQSGERRALARWDNEGGARERDIGPLPEPAIELAKRLEVTHASSAKLIILTQNVQELTMVPQTRGPVPRARVVNA